MMLLPAGRHGNKGGTTSDVSAARALLLFGSTVPPL
jgi:hypothetical protein